MLSPTAAAEKFGRSAAFVVTIWSPGAGCSKAQRQLKRLGCPKIISFIPLFWKYSSACDSTCCIDLPSKVLQQRDSVQAALSVWADKASQHEYVAQVRFRLFQELEALPPPVEHEQYFPDDLFALADDETFVDCGAYDGDTIRAFLRRKSSFCGIVALEPDAVNFQKLRNYVATLPPEIGGKLRLRQCAVGAANGQVRFTAAGTASAVCADGASEIECLALDTALADASATYIKMDIEGAEADAIAGARRLIQDRLPLLAISVYHKQNDLWRIPLLIRSLSADYRLFLHRTKRLSTWCATRFLRIVFGHNQLKQRGRCYRDGRNQKRHGPWFLSTICSPVTIWHIALDYKFPCDTIRRRTRGYP